MLKAAVDYLQSNTRLTHSFFFSRPLVLIQSDDWGRIGIRDQEGFEQLRSAGIDLGEKPYDFYTLETADDVTAVADLLSGHQDCVGRSPCLEMNFIVANVDFQKTFDAKLREIRLRPLSEGLPGKWSRPGLFEAYAEGIAAGVFFPALHGVTHFCRPAMERFLARETDRYDLLRTFWQAETPYIHWRMPWVGYEYWDPESCSDQRFLSGTTQHSLIGKAVELFTGCFSVSAISACAPGYRANADTYSAWINNGIRVNQNGTRNAAAPVMERHGLLQVSRGIDFEPASHPSFSIDGALRAADECFARSVPAVVSVHAINFHSSLKNFRDQTLLQLNQFLCSLRRKYPDLLFVHNGDLWDIVNWGKYETAHGSVHVVVKQEKYGRRSAAAGC